MHYASPFRFANVTHIYDVIILVFLVRLVYPAPCSAIYGYIDDSDKQKR